MAYIPTPDQQYAIDFSHTKPAVVTAAAGSGKTTLLVDRIIRLISDVNNPLDITSLAIMTFTVNATQSIREKLNKALQAKIAKLSEDNSPEAAAERNYLSEQIVNLRRASISTINAFCLGIIRENFQQFDLPINFTIADDTKRTSMQWSAEQLAKQDFYDENSDNGFTADERETLFYTFSFEDDRALFESVSKTADLLSSYGNIDKWLDEAVDVHASTQNLEKKYLDVYIDYIEKQFAKLEKCINIIDSCFAEYQIKTASVQSDPKKAPACNEVLKVMTDSRDIDKKRFDAIKTAYNSFKANPSMTTLEAITSTAELTPENNAEKSKKDPQDKSKQLFGKTTKLFQDNYNDILKISFSTSEEQLSLPQQHAAAQTFSKLVKKYISYYSEIKRSQGCIDFSDCELLLLDKLRSDEDFRNQISQRFSCIIVDEFQDSNDVQAEIFKLLGNGHLFYVGDVKQAIYAFRGGNPMIMANLCKGTDGFSALPLNMNFRSRKQVIDVVNNAFCGLMTEEYGGVDYAKGNRLVLGAKFNPLSPAEEAKYNAELYFLDISGSEDEKTEKSAQFTANLIKKIHDDDTFFITKKDKDDNEIRVRPSYSDFIILTRKNKPIKQYREALAALDIPAITSKTKNFLASEEIGIVISLLKAIDNPLDDENTLNVLMSPLYNFDAEEIAKLKLGVLGYKEDEITDAEVEIISQCTRKGSLLKCLKFCTQKTGERFNSGDNEKLKNAEEVEKALSDRKISREISSKAQAYLRDLDCFRNFMSNNSTDNLIGKIYEDTDIFAVMSAYDDGRQRISNLRRFETIAEDFVAREYGMLNDFIRFIDKSIQDSSDIEEANTPESVENSVRIMSFHASKGLEAPICILAELEDKINNQDIKGSFLLNHDYYYSMDYVDKKDRYRFKTFSGNALRIVNEKRPIGEELRLLYVAMTRAQEKLIMIDKWNDSDLAKSVAMGFDPDFLFDESKPFHWVLGALNQDLDIKESKDGNKIIRDFSYNTLPLEIEIYNDEKFDAFVKSAPDAASVNKSDDKTDDQSNDKSENNGDFSDEAIELSKLISKTYENIEETKRQAKFSVTELAHKASPSFFTLTKPAFAASGRIRGTDVGNAYHNFMEHISFDVVKNSSDFDLFDNITGELHRVCNEEKITAEEMSCIQVLKIAEFFRSELGKRMLNSPRIEREFPFYAEIEVSEIDETLLGKVGIQGRIDAFFVENNKIVVIDYKTDVDIDAEKDAYEKQVKIYAKVLPMLLGMEVSQTYLYSFSKGTEHLI